MIGPRRTTPAVLLMGCSRGSLGWSRRFWNTTLAWSLATTFGAIIVLAPTASEVGAQSGALGSITFETSGSRKAHRQLLVGLAALHSFWRPEAVAAFREAQELDPDFAMAYWGEALAYDGVWGTGHDSAAAVAALERLAPTAEERRAKAPTARERAYLAAVELLYRAPGDALERARRYAAAMTELVRRYPEDVEAKVLLARALLASVDVWTYKDPATLLRAGRLAEEALAANPGHPGAAHYVIHAYDSPEQAPRALDAAWRYADMAPASSHALHMPSHIFVQLGMWRGAVATNRRAFEASDAWVRERGLPSTRRDHHAADFLFYAHLQLGQYERALEALDLIRQDYDGTEDWSWAGQWYYRGLATYALETGRADVLPNPLPDVATGPRLWYVLGALAVRGGDLGEARRWHGRIVEAMRDADEGSSERIRREVVSLELEALMAAAEGDAMRAEEAALRAVRLTALLSPPNELPNPPQPVHELYGEVLLLLDRPLRAAAHYDLALEMMPNRPVALVGRARAAKALGDEEGVRRFYQQVLEVMADADPGAPPVLEAREYLGR